jgi:E-phenylitaconyl-CoA hydratase
MTDLNELASLEFEVSDHVATVTLNRPDRMNSFNERMADELAAVWSRVRDDVEIHVGVLQANGDRAFCTGIDVSEGVWWYDKPIFNQEDPGEHLGPKAHKVRKPVIAALHGLVAGGAMYFVNECDSRSVPSPRSSSIHMPTPVRYPHWSRWGCWPRAFRTAR